MILEGDASTWNRLRFDTAGTGSWGVAVNPDRKFAISRLDSGFEGTPDDDNFIIDTTGNVGIGSASPSNTLQVVGGVTATSFTGSLLGNVTGNATTATTATNVAWTGVTSGVRNNYTLGFEPPSTGYSGFYFQTNGGDENGGYLLIRGGADTGVYTQNGITLVADAGWLTLAQRTQSDKGIRFMTGATSTTQMTILNGGNVGIGTTNPEAKLDVRAGSGFIRLGSYDNNYHIKIESGDQLNFRNGASAAVGYIQYNGPGDTLLGRNLYVEGNPSGSVTGAVLSLIHI